MCHDLPCFLTWQANDLDGTSLDQLLDMTIPCLATQIQSFSIFTIEPAQGTCMASPIHFLLILLFRFSERDMISNFNGTVSNM